MLHGSGELRWFEVEARDLTAEDEVRGIVSPQVTYRIASAPRPSCCVPRPDSV